MKESVEVLISEDVLMRRVNELASEIMKDYEGKNISMLCILKGGVIFMVDLARRINMPVEFDFMDISSYGSSTESSGEIRINLDLETPITGKHVLLVEDIIDSGRTLGHLVKHLSSKNPASLKICALLDKPERRVVENVSADYTGFVIPDKFIVGYGLDYDQKYRNLPFIGSLNFE